MGASFARAWRVPATALAFASFGLGGVLLWLVFFPLLNLSVREPVRRTAIARAAVQRTFGWFVEWMRLLGLISYQIEGRERLARGGLLILANHPTLIDVVFLISLVRNADCVVRAGLAENPFTRGPIRATGYIRNNGGADLLQDCRASLEAGGNLIIFPEGTRSRPGEPLQLQRGAAQLALRAGRSITPVRIRCEPLGLNKGRPWWKTADRPLHFHISIGQDITTPPYLEAAAGEPALAARRLTGYLRDYFSSEREPPPCRHN